MNSNKFIFLRAELYAWVIHVFIVPIVLLGMCVSSLGARSVDFSTGLEKPSSWWFSALFLPLSRIMKSEVTIRTFDKGTLCLPSSVVPLWFQAGHQLTPSSIFSHAIPCYPIPSHPILEFHVLHGQPQQSTDCCQVLSWLFMLQMCSEHATPTSQYACFGLFFYIETVKRRCVMYPQHSNIVLGSTCYS